MCRKLLIAATTLSLLAAPAAHAQFLRGKPKADKPPAAATPAPPPRPAKATPEQRAAADRADSLTRSVFWNQQLQADPNDIEAGVKYAAALRALNRPLEAAKAAEMVLIISASNVEAMLEVGRARIQANQAFYGIEVLRRATTVAPRDWRAWSLLGVSYEQVQRPDDAVAAFEQALRISPENPAVLSNLAMFYAARGEAAKAEPLLRRAAASPDAAKEVRLNLAMILGMQGNLTEAERLLREELPPEMANNNLAYLQAFHAKAASPSEVPTRTWESLKTGG